MAVTGQRVTQPPMSGRFTHTVVTVAVVGAGDEADGIGGETGTAAGGDDGAGAGVAADGLPPGTGAVVADGGCGAGCRVAATAGAGVAPMRWGACLDATGAASAGQARSPGCAPVGSGGGGAGMTAAGGPAAVVM